PCITSAYLIGSLCSDGAATARPHPPSSWTLLTCLWHAFRYRIGTPPIPVATGAIQWWRLGDSDDFSHFAMNYKEPCVKVLGRMAVFPLIPPRIGRLHELAYNLWWTWTPDAQALYATIDSSLWEQTEHNAVRMLIEAPTERLSALAKDDDYLAQYDRVL